METNNNINHPKHYEGKIECIEAMVKEFGATFTAQFCLCNAYKYLWRAGLKENNPEDQDTRKAQWYLDKYAQLTGIFISVEELMWKVIKYK